MDKKCSKCQMEKDSSEFSKCKNNADGFAFHCKECRKKYYQEKKELYKGYKEKLLNENPNYQNELRIKNKEKILLREHEYRKKNAEKIRDYHREYYQKVRKPKTEKNKAP